MTFNEIIQELAEALTAEIAAAQSDPARAFDVIDGQYVTKVEEGFLYSFRADTTLPFPADSPLKVWVTEEDILNGRIVGQEEFEILLAVDEHMGDFVARAKVSSESWFIHQALRAHLLDMIEVPPRSPDIASALVGLKQLPTGQRDDVALATVEALKQLGNAALLPNVAQFRAIASCAGSKLHFVWGPPGTGKTTCLAQVARGLAACHEKILVLSHSNAAVDAAMLKIADLFYGTDDLADGKILRVGTPHLKEARMREEILPEGIIKRHHPAVSQEKENLEHAIKHLIRQLKQEDKSQRRSELSQQLAIARAALLSNKVKRREITKQLIADANIIGATVSRLAVNADVWGWAPDAVITDEVSMVNFPSVFAASTLANKRLLIFGDFRQLPPIALSNHALSDKWLARDAFDIAGVKAQIESGKDDPRVTLLYEQHRMAQPIQDVVNSLAYGGKLTGAPGLQEKLRPLAELGPWPGDHLILLDTSDIGSACLIEAKPGSYSRTNPMHSLVTAAGAFNIAASGSRSIGIISPYKAQARLINKIIRGLALSESVSVATVHRYQGAERDAIIMDLTDSLPEKRASRLTGVDVDLALRLLNVGISRAKGKLLIIANVDFVEGYHPGRSPARRLVALCRQHGKVVRLTAESLSQALGCAPVRWFSNWQECQDVLAEDLRSCNQSAAINFYEGYPISPALLRAITEVSQEGIPLTVFAPYEIGKQFESTAVDVRLLTCPGGFFALINEAIGYIGGLQPQGVVGRIANAATVESQSEILLAVQAILPALRAETEAAISDICGHE
jgi:hypothetical protein